MNDANLSSNGLTLTEKGGTFFAFNNVFVGFFSRLSETLDVNALNKVAKVRNVDEITSPTIHHSFRPPLSGLKSQKY
ncbi:MAG: hypothetical protein JRG74_10265 [Deltaproteobacteria bacterium]|nr:hypothetical protein [Deltaproteobacteria bacterium]